MPELTAYRDLMASVGAVGKYRRIRAADTGIEILHQHVVVSDFGQRQFPDFNMLFP